MLPKFLTHLNTKMATRHHQRLCCTFPVVLISLLLLVLQQSIVSSAEKDFNFNDSQVPLIEPKDEQTILIDTHHQSSTIHDEQQTHHIHYHNKHHLLQPTHHQQQQQHLHHEIEEQDPYAVELSHCRYGDNEIVLSLVLKSYNWHDFNESRKAKVLEKLSKFFAIPKEFITMESVTKHELYEMQKVALKKGNNKCHNNNRKLGRVNFIIGCGSKYFTVSEPLTKQIGEQFKNGALDSITGEKFGWWIIWNKQYKTRAQRNRRQIEGSGDDDEDEEYDYEDDYDGTDVVTSTTTASSHAHRHHHGDETSEITNNMLELTNNENLKNNNINNNINSIVDNNMQKINRNDDITALKQTDIDNRNEDEVVVGIEEVEPLVTTNSNKDNIDEDIVKSVSQLESVITKTIENTKNLDDIPVMEVDQTADDDDLVAEVLQPLHTSAEVGEVETSKLATNVNNINLNTLYENSKTSDNEDDEEDEDSFANVAEVVDSLTPSSTATTTKANAIVTKQQNSAPASSSVNAGVNVQENFDTLTTDSTTPLSFNSNNNNNYKHNHHHHQNQHQIHKQDNHHLIDSDSSPNSSSSHNNDHDHFTSTTTTHHSSSSSLPSRSDNGTSSTEILTEITNSLSITITNKHLTSAISSNVANTATPATSSSSSLSTSTASSLSSPPYSSSSSSTVSSTVLNKDDTTLEPENTQDLLSKASSTTPQSIEESSAIITSTATVITTTPAPTPVSEVQISTTTALPDYVEPRIENTPPMIKNRINKLAVTAGKIFRYSVPKDTFYDSEDFSNLRLDLTNENGHELKSNSWLQFNAETREIYGLPLEDTVSRWSYRLTATDSGNESVTENVEIFVQQHRYVRSVNHEINIAVKINEKSMHFIDWPLKLIEAIAKTLGDADTSAVVVREIRSSPQDPNTATLVYFNETFPNNVCPERVELTKLVKRLDVSRLNDLVQPTLGIKQLTGQLIGNCKETNDIKPKTPTINIKNVNPVPRNQIDRINATMGHLLVYKVPSDTFFDSNDNELTLSLKTKDHKELSPRHWLQFDSKNEEFYGIPKSGDIGDEEYQLVAEDAGGLTANDALVVVVYPAPKKDFSVYIKFYLAIRHELFNADLQRKFVERIAALFGDSTTQNIQIRSINPHHDFDGTIVNIYNTTLFKSHNRCPEEEMEMLRNVYLHDDTVRERVKKTLGPELNVTKVQVITAASCNAQTDVTHREFIPTKTEEPLLKSTFSEDYLYTIILPAIIIVAMILIALIVACCLHRRRRKSGKMELGDEEERKSFRTKGIPVIFQDELDEKPEIGNKSPIILKDEKPPLLPPSYNTSNMNGDNDVDEYVPPPAVVVGGREARGKSPATPSYRKPPPYVSP